MQGPSPSSGMVQHDFLCASFPCAQLPDTTSSTFQIGSLHTLSPCRLVTTTQERVISLNCSAAVPEQDRAEMLSRAGRMTGLWLRPTLRLRGDTGHICPLVPRPAVSAASSLPVSPCLPQLSCRHGSSKANNHTPDPYFLQPPTGNKQPTSAEAIGTLLKATQATDPRDIVLEFDKLYAPVTLSKLWLRDACQCHLCVSESSGQKRFATCDIPSDLKVDSLRVLEDGGLEVSWGNDLGLGSDQHVSAYPLTLLQDVLLKQDPYQRKDSAREVWDSQRFEKDSHSREISYASWMEDGSRFAEAFRNLHHWGLVVIRGVPQTESAVEQVASRLGHLQATFYGPTWDVVSKPQAENVAYTNEFLCLHQDLMYLKEPPRIQILHCLENGCEGGDSLFSDGLRAAYDLRLRNQGHYRTLVSSAVDFHYAKGGHYWHNNHKTIVTAHNRTKEKDPAPLSVRWSPPFQAPFWTALRRGADASSLDNRAGFMVERWQEAAKVFRESVEDPVNMVQFRLQPGDCVVFDNWRVLHGRRAFDTASGRRHLRGTYVEDQALSSTWIRLQREGLMFPDENESFRKSEGAKARSILGLVDGPAVADGSGGEVEA